MLPCGVWLLAAVVWWAAAALGADILIIDPIANGPATSAYEYTQARALGLSVDVKTAAQFQAMSTEEFRAYKALAINPWGRGSGKEAGFVQFLIDSKSRWGPAIGGNVILVGTDPANHVQSTPGALALIKSSISFAAAGTTTGFYMQMPNYVANPAFTTGTDFGFLDAFGPGISIRYNGESNQAHMVASHPALLGLSDAQLSRWGNSVHGLWSAYPAGFQPLTIGVGSTGPGIQTYADGSTGVPYIIARGAIPASCGNGAVNPGEECDSGADNGLGDNVCSDTCTCRYGVTTTAGGRVCNPAPRCGDSKVDAGEQCDGGDASNGASGGLCSSTCTCVYGTTTNASGTTVCASPRCGDGSVNQAAEQCDEGSQNGVSGGLCSSTCTCVYGTTADASGATVCASPKCGDGSVNQASEQCDEGDQNGVNGELCSSTCTCVYGTTTDASGATICVSPSCGDGTVNQSSEQCDDGQENGASDSLCASDCTCAYGLRGSVCAPKPVCGDATVNQSSEQCDDGQENGTSDSLCASDCTCAYGLRGSVCAPKPICGDGFINGDDECDDGDNNGASSGSVCSSTCTCMFGVASGSGASTVCNGPPSCGDGRVNAAAEQCDEGDANGTDGSLCAASCTCRYGLDGRGTACGPAPVCGDGVVGFREECDDGAANGDGEGATCSSECLCTYGLAEEGPGCSPPPPPPPAAASPSDDPAPSSSDPATAEDEPTSTTSEDMSSTSITSEEDSSISATTEDTFATTTTEDTSAPTTTEDASPSTTSEDTSPTDTTSDDPPEVSREPASPSNPALIPLDPHDEDEVVGFEFIFVVEAEPTATVARRHMHMAAGGDSPQPEHAQDEPQFTRAIYTREIYATSLGGRPWYPQAIGLPTDGGVETVYTTTTLCRDPDPTPIFAYKLCINCPLATTTAAVPDYIPGVCVSCTLVEEYEPGGGGCTAGFSVVSEAPRTNGLLPTVVAALVVPTKAVEPMGPEVIPTGRPAVVPVGSDLSPITSTAATGTVTAPGAGLVTVITVTQTITISMACEGGPGGRCTPVTSCSEWPMTFTVPPDYCTTFTSTRDDGRLTTCTEALAIWTPPVSESGVSYELGESKQREGQQAGSAGKGSHEENGYPGQGGHSPGSGRPRLEEHIGDGHEYAGGRKHSQDGLVQIGAARKMGESLLGTAFFVAVAMLLR